MKFLLLVGCLSLSAFAAFITVRLRILDRKAPLSGNNVLPFRDKIRRSPPELLEPIRR